MFLGSSQFTYIVENAAMRFGALARAVSVLHAHHVGNFFLVFFFDSFVCFAFLFSFYLPSFFAGYLVCGSGCTECGPVSTALALWPRTLGT
jgi:hypothetical protein